MRDALDGRRPARRLAGRGGLPVVAEPRSTTPRARCGCAAALDPERGRARGGDRGRAGGDPARRELRARPRRRPRLGRPHDRLRARPRHRHRRPRRRARGGGRTVAVLGSGIDRPTRARTRRSPRRSPATGALVSEFPPGTEPWKGNFPRRNRTIAGWSRLVVVVEAGERSGALITARVALDEGRDVMAVPGHPSSPAAAGTNALLRDGAASCATPATCSPSSGSTRPRRAGVGAVPRTTPSSRPCRAASPRRSRRSPRASRRPVPELLARLSELELSAHGAPRRGRAVREKLARSADGPPARDRRVAGQGEDARPAPRPGLRRAGLDGPRARPAEGAPGRRHRARVRRRVRGAQGAAEGRRRAAGGGARGGAPSSSPPTPTARARRSAGTSPRRSAGPPRVSGAWPSTR